MPNDRPLLIKLMLSHHPGMRAGILVPTQFAPQTAVVDNRNGTTTITGGGDVIVTASRAAQLALAVTGGGVTILNLAAGRSATFTITGGGAVTISAVGVPPQSVQFDVVSSHGSTTRVDQWSPVMDDELVLSILAGAL